MIQVKVGDEVGFGRYHTWGTLLQHGFSKVIKINRWGHIILENGKVFNKDGQERGDHYGALHIMEAQRLREVLEGIQQRRDRNAVAHQLQDLLEAQRNGHGDNCKVNDETRARMIELVNKL
jgi:hypothetical protein